MNNNCSKCFKLNKSIHSNCGVFGIFNHPNAAVLTYYGLHALQHRGQEAAGIVSCYYDEDANKHRFAIHKGPGLVLEVFENEKIITEELKGYSAIGHNRYSTTGAAGRRNNIQPFKVSFKNGNLALSHNGNLTNTIYLRNKLEEDGTIFQTTSDSEIFLHLIARSKSNSIEQKVLDALTEVEGAYSICILTDEKLIAARDPLGFRPLAIGKLGNSFIFASETTAFDIINAEFIRDVLPGEMVVIDDEVIKSGKLKSYVFAEARKYKFCIFEYIYFSRPDSDIFGEKVDKVRRRIGMNLALEHPPPDKDNPLDEDEKKVIIINVPDSSNTATLGYFNEAIKYNKNIKHEIGLIRSHYIGRTFIQPGDDDRKMRIKFKFNIVRGVLEGRKVVIVDDSIVRGNTLKSLVDLIRRANPKEIHLRITSPPIISPCYYGMDFPSKEELIAYQHNGNVEEIRKYLGVDSLGYLSLDSLLKSVPFQNDKVDYCTACFSGEYPIPIEAPKSVKKNQFD